MKNHLRSIALVIFILLCFSAISHAEIIRGDNGDKVNWTFNTITGEFSLFGSGTKWLSDSTEMLPWNEYIPEIRSVHIASDVTYIGSWAFAGCSLLKEFILPSSVTHVGIGLLYNCDGITEPVYNDSVFLFLPPSFAGPYILPEGPRTVAGGALFGCKELTSLKIPETYTNIGDYAFSHCSNIMTVTIKGDLKEISDGAFEECSNLKTIKLPDSITRIGALAFSGCVTLTAFVVPKGTKEIGAKAFALCSALNSIKFPSSLVKIEANAFTYCDELHSVNIPNAACKIERSSFPYHCTVTYK